MTFRVVHVLTCKWQPESFEINAIGSKNFGKLSYQIRGLVHIFFPSFRFLNSTSS